MEPVGNGAPKQIMLSKSYDGPVKTSDGMLEFHVYVIADIGPSRVVLGRGDFRVKDIEVWKQVLMGAGDAIMQQSRIVLPK